MCCKQVSHAIGVAEPLSTHVVTYPPPLSVHFGSIRTTGSACVSLLLLCRFQVLSLVLLSRSHKPTTHVCTHKEY